MFDILFAVLGSGSFTFDDLVPPSTPAGTSHPVDEHRDSSRNFFRAVLETVIRKLSLSIANSFQLNTSLLVLSPSPLPQTTQLSARVYIRPQGLVVIPFATSSSLISLPSPSPSSSSSGSPSKVIAEPPPPLAPNTPLVLCPFGIQAKFTRWISHHEGVLRLKAADELRLSLSIWGASADKVGEAQHWALCRLDDNKEVIWPDCLCLMQAEVSAVTVTSQIPTFFPFPFDPKAFDDPLEVPATQAGEYVDALVKARERDRRERMERAVAAAQEQQRQQNIPVASPSDNPALSFANGVKPASSSPGDAAYSSTPAAVSSLSASSSTAIASIPTPMDIDTLHSVTWDAFDGVEGGLWADGAPDADMFEMGGLTDADFNFFDEPGPTSSLSAPPVPADITNFYTAGASPKLSVSGTPFAVHSSPADRFEGSPHTALSPFKTPKTPFSPFVEVEGDDNSSSPAQARSLNQGHPPRRFSVSIAQTPGSPNKWLAPSNNGFEPIVFGTSHMQADERYGFGNKFYLPTPESTADTHDSPSGPISQSKEPGWLKLPAKQRFSKSKRDSRAVKSGKRFLGRRRRPWTTAGESTELTWADSDISSNTSESDSEEEPLASKSLSRENQRATLEQSTGFILPLSLLGRALATKTEAEGSVKASSELHIERAKEMESTMAALCRQVVENPTLRRHCGVESPLNVGTRCGFIAYLFH
jgi:hypothetical protein